MRVDTFDFRSREQEGTRRSSFVRVSIDSRNRTLLLRATRKRNEPVGNTVDPTRWIAIEEKFKLRARDERLIVKSPTGSRLEERSGNTRAINNAKVTAPSRKNTE